MNFFLHYLVLIIVFTLHKIGLYLQKMVSYIKKVILWLKKNGYNNPMLYIGLILYSYIIYRVLFRTRISGFINDIPISPMLLISYLLLTIVFLIRVIFLMYRLYNKNKEIIPKSKLFIFIGKIANFYEIILNTTYILLSKSVWGIHEFVVFLRPYCNEIMRESIFLTILVILRYGISLFISICFFIDVFIFNSFIYFPCVVILYSIPLFIRIILYILKTTSIVEYPKFYEDFNITIKDINIIHFSRKQEFKTVIDEKGKTQIYTIPIEIVQQAHDYFCYMHYAWFRISVIFEEILIKNIYFYPIQICQFFTSWIFLCSWIKLTSFALINYF